MNQIDFLPSSFHEQQKRQRRMARQWLLLTLLAVCLVGLWGQQHRQTEALSNFAVALGSQAHAARLQRSEMVKLLEEYDLLRHQLKIQRELAQPIGHAEVLAVLGQIMPEAVTVTRMSVATRRPAPAKAEPAPETPRRRSRFGASEVKPQKQLNQIEIQIVGLSPDDLLLASLVSDLTDSALFDNVQLNYSRNEKRYDVTVREFQLSLIVPLDRSYQPYPQQRMTDAN